MKYGDIIEALPGTSAAAMSEGRLGKVVEVRDPHAYSDNDSRNLVRWGDDPILCGFHPEHVIKKEITE